jgi:hypothetical protein
LTGQNRRADMLTTGLRDTEDRVVLVT